ncbi:hypothetical protein GNF76_22840 [Pseudomonas sp. CCM 7893]|uniref:Lipoprotein n=1 Tax=Pseudomonas spelaei TaxID=1055469 RepID=A0A6I3WH74_9PSED|nr:hypothetical protein [Pseudomonas spelaei]MUF07194.1 hypothetical protein [Pseudomonas spelaei]
MRVLIGALLLGVIGGCSTSPISAENADPVPAPRLYAFTEKSAAQLVVTRDSGIYGSEVRFILHIDGKPAAEFHPGEVARFGLAPGKHILGVSKYMIFGHSRLIESEVEVKPGDLVRRRISQHGSSFSFTPTAY